jgi:hypothetical protein
MRLIPPTSASVSPIYITGTCTSTGCPTARLDNVTGGTAWSGIGIADDSFSVISDIFGVADHNTIGDTANSTNGLVAVNVGHGKWQGVGRYGDNSWASSETFGTNQAFYLENNLVSYALLTDTSTNAGTGGGARWVCRFNTVSNVSSGGGCTDHGTDTTGRARGGRQYEVYYNTGTCTNAQVCSSFIPERSGTGFVFGNSFTNNGGFFKGMGSLDAQRRWRPNFPWGACDGTSAWDTNDGKTYYAGTVGSVSSWSNNYTIQTASERQQEEAEISKLEKQLDEDSRRLKNLHSVFEIDRSTISYWLDTAEKSKDERNKEALDLLKEVTFEAFVRGLGLLSDKTVARVYPITADDVIAKFHIISQGAKDLVYKLARLNVSEPLWFDNVGNIIDGAKSTRDVFTAKDWTDYAAVLLDVVPLLSGRTFLNVNPAVKEAGLLLSEGRFAQAALIDNIGTRRIARRKIEALTTLTENQLKLLKSITDEMGQHGKSLADAKAKLSSGSITAAFTTNEWRNSTGPYSFVDLTRLLGYEIGANTSNSLTTYNTGWSFGTYVPAAGDSYEILRATVCMDQPGRGAGLLVTGDTPVLSGRGSPGSVNESLDPIYEADDAISNTGSYTISSATQGLLLNRDFYAESANQGAQFTPTSPFQGTSGTGHGTLANRPTSCTPGVGYFATDQGSWNVSGSGGKGVWYICTAWNTWSLSYTPYTYPHPLTQGTGPTSTVAPPPTLSPLAH